jgi:hypothetical protein
MFNGSEWAHDSSVTPYTRRPAKLFEIDAEIPLENLISVVIFFSVIPCTQRFRTYFVYIYFRLKRNLFIYSPCFLTICFGRIRSSSSVVYLAKTAAPYAKMYISRVNAILPNKLTLELKLIIILMLFPLWSSSIHLNNIFFESNSRCWIYLRCYSLCGVVIMRIICAVRKDVDVLLLCMLLD